MISDIDSSVILRIMPLAGDRAHLFAEPIRKAMQYAEINTRYRQACFLAQAAHETGQLKWLSENLNYKPENLVLKWPHRFTPEIAEFCKGKPVLVANYAYHSKYGNGDLASGDGWKFRGRGLFHLTFQDAYMRCGKALGLDLLNNPDLLLIPDHAAMSGAWFWKSNKLNDYADKEDFAGLTHVINTAEDGLKQRTIFLQRALAAIPPDA